MKLSNVYNPDYNLLSPDDLTKILQRPLEKAIGKREWERVQKVLRNYDYYDGKQHADENGLLVYPWELPRPDGMAYDPARYTTNYFKAFIKRKARWQMDGKHSIHVPADSENPEEIELAQRHEKLLYQLWHENDLESDRVRIARDRLIAGMIGAKIMFNPRTGKLHWIWHRADEVFPIYSDDAFQDLIGVDIIVPQEDEEDENKTQFWVQRMRMNDDFTDCTYEEAVYDEKLKLKRTIQEQTMLGLNFLPFVMFDVNDLKTRGGFNDEIEDMIMLTTKLNEMMEDATDSLKFEMFNITVVRNASPGTAEKLAIAPGAAVEINSDRDNVEADMKILQNSFQWSEAFKEQYSRIKAALHELSGLPQIVPQELNFGGLNDRALQVLYQDVIQETEEHWLSWNRGFSELFEKSVKYLQARSGNTNFSYDRSLVNEIEEFKAEMIFALPLPDDRLELVELLSTEVDNGFESRKGAQQRLGVENVPQKMREIAEERNEGINAVNYDMFNRVEEEEEE